MNSAYRNFVSKGGNVACYVLVFLLCIPWCILYERVLLNVSKRHFTRNGFFYLLFPILFTAGFILGSLYSLSFNTDGYRQAKNQLEHSQQENFSYLIVVIFTSPENLERRHVIRKTWLLTKKNNKIKHYFALSVGSLSHKKLISLKDEHKIYQDLLFLYSFSDSYSRLSEKLKDVLRWVDKNVQFRFLLKVDDDSFVRLDALSDALQKLPKEKLYWGFFDGQASVKTRGKWKEKNWFLCDRYLPYAKGGGYVLSQDLVRLVASVSDHLTLYQNEDVSLGTWLAPFEIRRVHEPNFDTEYHSRGCFNSYLVTHKQTFSMMEEKYSSLVDTGKLCQQENRIRNSYVYNWNVPPSQCCVRSETVP